jgi:zinc transporter ZupT
VSDISKRSTRTPRRVREKRANQLVLVGGVAGLVAVVGFLLVVFGVIGAGIPLLAAVIAGVCIYLFRKMVS